MENESQKKLAQFTHWVDSPGRDLRTVDHGTLAMLNRLTWCFSHLRPPGTPNKNLAALCSQYAGKEGTLGIHILLQKADFVPVWRKMTHNHISTVTALVIRTKTLSSLSTNSFDIVWQFVQHFQHCFIIMFWCFDFWSKMCEVSVFCTGTSLLHCEFLRDKTHPIPELVRNVRHSYCAPN